MDFTFRSTELATLHDLQTMAQKHGGYIEIDVDAGDCHELYKEEIQEETGLPLDKLYVYDTYCTINELGFCLVIGNDAHILYLREISMEFDYSFPNYLTKKEIEDLENEGFEFEEGGRHYSDTVLKTKIKGFATIPETVKSVNVYRYGIALREFSNLVCDYLGEPRIDRVY